MTKDVALAILMCSTTAHYVIAMVMFVYARHQVRYLSIAWIMAILAFLSTFICLIDTLPVSARGFLQPAALLLLVIVCYLQSIYPLSFVMPGYLQWQRMVKYASPVMALILLYTFPLLLGKTPLVITSTHDLLQHLLSYDILIRLASLALSLAYIVNIFRLPHRLTHKEFPRYLVGYSLCLGLSAVFYAVVCVLRFNLLLATIYILCFTVLNLYLSLRTLETMALELPKPTITTVEQNPSERDLEQAQRDFNELNQKRFERVEYWMQHNTEAWKDNTFGRNQLCRETGLNRHLLLQCVRSQGYNNVHDYLSFYRIAELKRMIESGEVTNLTECQDAGFGTTKTVRNCFLRCEGVPVEDFLAAHAPEK
ncbi:MAG: hypothetical protein LUI09_05555 [Prevotellaceae bacterium]|nr:hypothetical protein [Prevotellaceae bacterium]